MIPKVFERWISRVELTKGDSKVFERWMCRVM